MQKTVPSTIIALRQRQAYESKVAGSADKLKVSCSGFGLTLKVRSHSRESGNPLR